MKIFARTVQRGNATEVNIIFLTLVLSSAGQ